MTEVQECEHKEWVGEPMGCVPAHWLCTECFTKITAGEMMILRRIKKLEYILLGDVMA